VSNMQDKTRNDSDGVLQDKSIAGLGSTRRMAHSDRDKSNLARLTRVDSDKVSP
jgi:hypothetical protein